MLHVLTGFSPSGIEKLMFMRYSIVIKFVSGALWSLVSLGKLKID
jgi:hypothetical protein